MYLFYFLDNTLSSFLVFNVWLKYINIFRYVSTYLCESVSVSPMVEIQPSPLLNLLRKSYKIGKITVSIFFLFNILFNNQPTIKKVAWCQIKKKELNWFVFAYLFIYEFISFFEILTYNNIIYYDLYCWIWNTEYVFHYQLRW